MNKVLFIGPKFGFQAANDILDGLVEVIYVNPHIDDLSCEIVDSIGIIDASMKVPINEQLILKSKNFKIISCATTGSDHIDSLVIEKFGITLKTLKEDKDLIQNLTPAAELSWALLMACARNLKGAFSHVDNSNWDRELFPGVMLKGKTIGIIGCGRIGGWMSKYALAFGMRVIGFDPFINVIPNEIEKVSLEYLLAESDFITVHVHLSDLTENLLSNELLLKTKKGVIIINTSRGKIINEEGLLRGLESGHIAACGLDVLDGEPNIKDHKLLKYSQENNNLIITPHCGGYSPDAVKLVCERASLKIKNFVLENNL